MKKALLIILGLCSLQFAHAQTSPVNILQRTADKIHSFKSISYKEEFVEKNPFSAGDTSSGVRQSALIFDARGSIKAMHKETNINKGQIKTREIYLNDTLFTIDLNENIYSVDYISDKSQASSDLIDVASFIKDEAIKNPSKIFQRKDTTIGRISCYNFFIKTYDSIVNNNHNYTYHYLLINKATLMPVYAKWAGEGIAAKAGHVIGRVKFGAEQYFSGFRFNEETNDSKFHFDRSLFDLKNEKMLAEGAIAPELILKDLSNEKVPPSDFKNKILLVEFGATDCGANPLANPMLNRLNKKYASKDFSIVSIYSTETPDQVKKYIESNHLEFPVYLGSRTLKKEFKTTATPNFYLIDKNGKIVKSIEGYSDELEKELIKEIDRSLE